MDWDEITRRIRSGDMEAFGVYYDRCFEVMLREVRRLVQTDESTALDIVQDAMLKAGRSMRVLSDEPSVRAWTAVVVKSVTYDWLRRQRRQRAIVSSLDEAANVETRSVAADSMELEARQRWLAEQLNQLPSDLRQLVDLRYRMCWTLERIGRQLGLRTGCVDGKLRRLVDQLRASAAEQKFEDG